MTRVFAIVSEVDAVTAGLFVATATQNTYDAQTFTAGIPLSADGTEPATHRLASFWLTDNFQQLMDTAGVPSYVTMGFSSDVTLDEFLASMGLQRVLPSETV